MSCKFAVSFVLGALVWNTAGKEVLAQQQSAPAKAAKHMHSTRGPHGGELLEIGKEEYHAELVVDESKKQLIVYLLEKDAQSGIAIDAPDLAVNLVLKGKPVQIKLKALPQEVDPKGFASCFGVNSPELMDALHTPKSDPRLSVRIRNKSYVAKIIHKHDHTGHSHAEQPVANSSKKR